MSIPDTCDTNISKEPSQNKAVLEKIQQYLKEKSSCEFIESGRQEATFSGRVDQNQNTIITEEDSAENTLLKQVLDYKKSLLLRDPEIVEIIKNLTRK